MTCTTGTDISDAGFAIGRSLFDRRLRDEHLLSHDAKSLEKLGWELLRQTQSEMNRVAAEVTPGKDWKEVVGS